MSIPCLIGAGVALVFLGVAAIAIGALCGSSWLILDTEHKHMDDYSGRIGR